MPSPKRWFKLNRDINDDPEFDELCQKFGVAGTRIFLEVMGCIDKTDNEWKVGEETATERKFSERTERRLATKCRTTLPIVRKILQWMLEQSWIIVAILPDHSCIVMAPNYKKYNKNWVTKWDLSESPPYLALPCLTKEREKKEGVVNYGNNENLNPKKLAALEGLTISSWLREWAKKRHLEIILDAELIRFKKYHLGYSLEKFNGDPIEIFKIWCLNSKDQKMGKYYEKDPHSRHLVL